MKFILISGTAEKFIMKNMDIFEAKENMNLERLNNIIELDNIVQDLGKSKIGNSSFTQEQISLGENSKEAVDTLRCIINESPKTTETDLIDGQGDANIKTVPGSSTVDEIISAEAFRFRNEVGSKPRKDSIQESTSFLRKMIQEMEDQVPKKVIGPVVKEEIAVWEEQEEKLIRIIDGPIIDNNVDIIIDDNEEEEYELLIEEEIGEMNFIGKEPKISSLLSNVLSSKDEYVEEITIEEVGSFPLSPDNQKPKCLSPPPTKLPLPPVPVGGSELESKDNCKPQKPEKAKKWFGNKFRKLFYFAYGRNKH